MAYDPNSLPVGGSDAVEYWRITEDLIRSPEGVGMQQAGIDADEFRRLASSPQTAAFMLERLDDVNTLADPRLQESIRQWQEGDLIDITPAD